MYSKSILNKTRPLPVQNNSPFREIKPALTGLFDDILSSGSSLRIRVTGNSMAPFLRGGEIVTIRKTPVSSLKRGDLIFFTNSEDVPFLHRIIKRDKKAFTLLTKGDALRYYDKAISSENVMGRVCIIENEKTFPGFKHINMGSIHWRAVNYLIATFFLIRLRLSNASSFFRNRSESS
jgi:signal peptidase I